MNLKKTLKKLENISFQKLKNIPNNVFFYNLEGVDGVGKTTLVNILKEELEKENNLVLCLDNTSDNLSSGILLKKLLNLKSNRLSEQVLFNLNNFEMYFEEINNFLLKTDVNKYKKIIFLIVRGPLSSFCAGEFYLKNFILKYDELDNNENSKILNLKKSNYFINKNLKDSLDFLQIREEFNLLLKNNKKEANLFINYFYKNYFKFENIIDSFIRSFTKFQILPFSSFFNKNLKFIYLRYSYFDEKGNIDVEEDNFLINRILKRDQKMDKFEEKRGDAIILSLKYDLIFQKLKNCYIFEVIKNNSIEELKNSEELKSLIKFIKND